ncbi:unnamed protein product [Heligmosomoides polygyrus]|uniref:HTH_48 domain-containing protein n=1 Tax=Heligmosomoides polygyrus TaxID=6339 RepID=A0A3P7XRD6_HELPZ|nr:unnamed protein product [Heligmosomoides polygyrus]
MDKRVIRGIYLYEFKLGTTAKEADEKINAAFGQGCSTFRTAYRWYQKFRNGDESLEEREGRGRHSDVDEDKLRDVVEEDPHKGVRQGDTLFPKLNLDVGLQLNLSKMMFIMNGQVSETQCCLDGTNPECSSYVYLGLAINLVPDLDSRKRAPWWALKSVEEVVQKTKNVRLCVHLFGCIVLPALTYDSET